jgi:hypothetical protein
VAGLLALLAVLVCCWRSGLRLARRADPEGAQIIENARAEAARIAREAQSTASRADSEATRLIENATAEAARIVRDAQSRAEVAAASRRRLSVAIFFHGELAAVTDNFSDARRVGRGGFGGVYIGSGLTGLGTDAPQHAVKKLDPASLQGNAEFIQELQVLGACRHEHILPVLGFSADRGGSQQEDGVCIVTPLMRGGSLQDRLFVEDDAGARERLRMMSDEPRGRVENEISPMRWDQLLAAALGAITGLEFLHTSDPAVFKPEILHRDVKPSNVLLDGDGNARLADMGLARELRVGAGHLTTTVNVSGTNGYMEQQYLAQGQFDKLADGYAMGITLLVILTRWHAFEPEAGHIHARCLDRGEHEFVVTIAHQRAGWPREVAMEVLGVALDLTKPARGARITVSAARERLQRLADAHPQRAAAPVVEAVERECVVCMSAPRQVRFPCGHSQLCRGCADTYMQRRAPTCTMCRARVSREGLIMGDGIALEDTFVPPQHLRRRGLRA